MCYCYNLTIIDHLLNARCHAECFIYNIYSLYHSFPLLSSFIR